MYATGKTPHSGSLSLKMGKPGGYQIEYTPRLAGRALGPFMATIDVQPSHCVLLSVSSRQRCVYDPIDIEWRIPENIASETDWLGIHAVKQKSQPDGTTKEEIAPTPVHWLYLAGDQINRVRKPQGKLRALRLAQEGEYEVRMHISAGQANPSKFYFRNYVHIW